MKCCSNCKKKYEGDLCPACGVTEEELLRIKKAFKERGKREIRHSGRRVTF
jgi:hypothetical protein